MTTPIAAGAAPLRAVLWRFVGAPLFALTLHNAYSLRRAILSAFGARVAPSARFRRSARVERPWLLSAGDLTVIGDRAVFAGPEPIRVGRRCVVSQFALLLTETRDPGATGHPPRSAPITVEDDAWVAADALLLPGVTIGAGSVVGARSVVESSLPAWRICAGQPARPRAPRRFHNPTDA
jgi:putative colanic acid biosynthesis acetyltransferase WcaF